MKNWQAQWDDFRTADWVSLLQSPEQMLEETKALLAIQV